MLFRKPAVEAGGKKTGSKGHWKQYFVVIQKSDLHLFTFGQSRGSAFAGGSVGGGNWLVSLVLRSRADVSKTPMPSEAGTSCTLLLRSFRNPVSA